MCNNGGMGFFLQRGFLQDFDDYFEQECVIECV